MMTPTRLLPLLALLAACATRPPPIENVVPDTPVQTACRAESKNDPAVKAVLEQLNPGNWANEQRVGHEARVAELRAYRECMRRNGAPLAGGVEALRPL